jgi:hypothetical protein
MKTPSPCRVRRELLVAGILGGAGLAASFAREPAIAPPFPHAGAAQLVADACALVEPVDAPSSVAAATLPPEFKWKHRKLGAGSFAALAAGAAGESHVVFPSKVHSGKRELKHRWRVGNAWHAETIDSSLAPSYIGDQVALAMDSDGVLHVAYTAFDTEQQSGSLHYARGDGSGWQFETVEAGGYGSASIALDDAGVPHILHLVGGTSDDVRYLTREAGGWTGETFTTTQFSNHGSALLLHGSTVYAAYLDSAGNLAVALGDGKDWTIEAVGDGGGSCGLALDGEGVPHVAMVESGSDHALTHARPTWPPPA